FVRAAAACGVPEPQVRLATELPLYAVLPQMDVHITGLSSTVLEAESFGVRSVVTHPLGGELFEDAVRSGCVLSAVDDADILPALLRQSAARIPSAVSRDDARR